jgi:hypothetical protein
VIAGVLDTGNKFILIFITGDNDTGEQLSPVSLTPAITVFPSGVDIDQK